ncbi:MAG TPA: WYL domain-containing protein, partial [Egibacteraceae bacterium]|nr:WYL domain-containing protein [Egibacteraceae bacterium]
AWDVDRADWRTFRVDRLDPPQVTGIRFTPRRLPAEDAAAFVRESIGALASRHAVLVTVHASAESVAERWHWRDGLEAVDERTCRVRAEVESLEWLAAMIGVLDAEFEVHEPPELAAHVRALAGRFARSIASAPGNASSLGQDSR